jgi:hypothetical protein
MIPDHMFGFDYMVGCRHVLFNNSLGYVYSLWLPAGPDIMEIQMKPTGPPTTSYKSLYFWMLEA